MKDVKILISTHKEHNMPVDKMYIPIHVGKKGKKELGYQGDDTGENISHKNSNYCELTALYWAWKNIECEYIGLCHYRRYFDFCEKMKNEKNFELVKDLNKILDVDGSRNIIENQLQKYDIILPVKRIYPISLRNQYKIMHRKNDWDTLEAVILQKYPEYVNTAKRVFGSNEAYLYNMFVMSKKRFNEYCQWLFTILSEVEKRIIVSESPYQSRVFGFMSERLFNVYIVHNSLNVKEIPIIYFEDSNKVPFRYKSIKLKRSISRAVFKVTKIISL